MGSLFAFAIGIRVAACLLFIACVYGGNVLFVKIEKATSKVVWKLLFVTLYSLFLLVVSYLVWFIFFFGLNA